MRSARLRHTDPVTHLLEGVLGLDPVLILVVTGLLVFAEDAIFVGFVVPGETAAVLAGVGAGLGHVPLALSVAVVVGAAIVGDSVGYEVGRRYFGPRVLDRGLFGRHQHRVERARALLRRRGGPAVFLGRFTAFFRAVMPALAGAARMRYRTFLLWNAVGGLVWGTIFVVLGYVAGASYQQVERQVGRGVAVVVATVVVVALVVWRVRARRRDAEV